jgi:hypothetical protein
LDANPLPLNAPGAHPHLHSHGSPSPRTSCPPRQPQTQIWLLVGVILILGSADKVYIPLIATGIFLAIVLIVPLVYGLVLSAKQRAAIAAWAASNFTKEGRQAAAAKPAPAGRTDDTKDVDTWRQ